MNNYMNWHYILRRSLAWLFIAIMSLTVTSSYMVYSSHVFKEKGQFNLFSIVSRFQTLYWDDFLTLLYDTFLLGRILKSGIMDLPVVWTSTVHIYPMNLRSLNWHMH